MSCRTPFICGHFGARLVGVVIACGFVRFTLRVLRPDGDVRQDIGLLIARDTAAQSAQVSRVYDPPGIRCPVKDTDLPGQRIDSALLFIVNLLIFRDGPHSA